jgi:hypothetical protein
VAHRPSGLVIIVIIVIISGPLHRRGPHDTVALAASMRLEFGTWAWLMNIIASDVLERIRSSARVQWVAAFEARDAQFINDAAGVGWVETDPEADPLLAICHEAHFIAPCAS